MATQEIYAIRDVKAEAFMRPFFVQNVAVCRRALTDALRDPQSPIHNNPEDYQAYKLGEYDDSNGKIKACPPEFLFNVVELKKVNSED